MIRNFTTLSEIIKGCLKKKNELKIYKVKEADASKQVIKHFPKVKVSILLKMKKKLKFQICGKKRGVLSFLSHSRKIHVDLSL